MKFATLKIWTTTLIMLLALSSQAFAILIIDTGEGSSGASGVPLLRTRNYAARFEIQGAQVINSIEAWIFNQNTSNLNLNFSLYDAEQGTLGGDPLPINSPAWIYQDDISLSPTTTAQWQGIYGIDLALPAGQYWLAIEQPQLTELGSYDSVWLPQGVANPLPYYATQEVGVQLYDPPGQPVRYLSSRDHWDIATTENRNWGLRVNASPVPEPGTLLTLAFGMGGLSLAKLRKRKK